LLAEFARGGGRGVWVVQVMGLLAEVAMRENPVYAHAPKMRALARQQANTSLYLAETARLRAFLRDNDALHIEGYVRFRMRAYAEMLDMLSYRLIKKLRLNARED